MKKKIEKLTENIVKLAFENYNKISVKYGYKSSIKFADEKNVSKHKHKVLHVMINQLGGYYSMEDVKLSFTEFEKNYNHYWYNLEQYPEVDHLVGKNEYTNGRYTQLINAKTGKHIFSDGTSFKNEEL